MSETSGKKRKINTTPNAITAPQPQTPNAVISSSATAPQTQTPNAVPALPTQTTVISSSATASTIKRFEAGDFVTTNPHGTYTVDGGLVYNPAGAMTGLIEAFSNRSSYKITQSLYKANSEAEEHYRKIFKPFAGAFHKAFPIQRGGKRKTRRALRAKRTRRVSKKYM